MSTDAVKNEKFLKFLGVVKMAWGESWEAAFAFFLGTFQGEKARTRIPDPGDVQNEFAFELGCQVGPELKAAGVVILRALIKTGIEMILASLKK